MAEDWLKEKWKTLALEIGRSGFWWEPMCWCQVSCSVSAGIRIVFVGEKGVEWVMAEMLWGPVPCDCRRAGGDWPVEAESGTGAGLKSWSRELRNNRRWQKALLFIIERAIWGVGGYMRIEEQKRKAVPGLSSNFDVLSTGRISQQCPLLHLVRAHFGWDLSGGRAVEFWWNARPL